MKFQLGDLVKVIDKSMFYNVSNLDYALAEVISVDGKWMTIELDGSHYEVEESEVTLYKRKTENQLKDTVIKFMKNQDITCEETIHQCDWVIENAYDFITDLFNIVKDDLNLEEDE